MRNKWTRRKPNKEGRYLASWGDEYPTVMLVEVRWLDMDDGSGSYLGLLDDDGVELGDLADWCKGTWLLGPIKLPYEEEQPGAAVEG